jgi:hypothetical protein
VQFSTLFFRTKPELVKALGEHYDLTAFDFVTGKINPLLLKPKSAVAAPPPVSESNKRKSTPNGNRYESVRPVL